LAYGGFLLVDESGRHADGKKVKFKKNHVGRKGQDKAWILTITAVSFIVTIVLTFFSSETLEKFNNFAALWVVIIIIFIGIIFDIIGVAVTAADETPFHAMASRKMRGAKRAIRLIRNANRVSSFCNDVVGDICSIISGTASALIVVRISGTLGTYESLAVSLIVSGLVAAATVGGKALGKTFAMVNSNYIVYKVSSFIQFFADKLGIKDGRKQKG